jgi:hypothetical protein
MWCQSPNNFGVATPPHPEDYDPSDVPVTQQFWSSYTERRIAHHRRAVPVTQQFWSSYTTHEGIVTLPNEER